MSVSTFQVYRFTAHYMRELQKYAEIIKHYIKEAYLARCCIEENQNKRTYVLGDSFDLFDLYYNLVFA